MFTEEYLHAATQTLTRLRENGLRLATAESCTGGLVAGLLTAIGGSSDVVERGWVTYSNEAKIQELGVSAEIIDEFSPVSEETALAMAKGILAHSPADIALSVTGIAGPGGSSEGKPVGLVWFGYGKRGKTIHSQKEIFPGNRQQVRDAAVLCALQLIQQALGD